MVRAFFNRKAGLTLSVKTLVLLMLFIALAIILFFSIDSRLSELLVTYFD